MNTDKKILSYSRAALTCKKLRERGKDIVFTSGCYDILHLGHVVHFNYCRSKGDILVVSVGNDKTVRELKGPTRPINNERFRARMVAALAVVDYVVISTEFGKMDHDHLIRLLRPDYYVVPVTDSMIDAKKTLVKANGGKLITCHRLPPDKLKGGISTTQIEKALAKEKVSLGEG